MTYKNTLAFAQQLDQTDTLAPFRDRFFIPKRDGRPLIYLCGNSLGLQPKAARQALNHELDTWQNLGVDGWFEQADEQQREGAGRPWLNYHESCKQALADIVGATADEVCPMNALTVNIHLLLASFYRPTATKYKILTIKGDFPSDQYALETHVKHRGFSPDEAIIEIAPQADSGLIHTTDIQRAIAEHADELAVIWLSGLNYYTGQVYNMAALAGTAQQHCIPIGLDLAHAIGNVPLRLHDWGVDFATWCSYKYLNSGPGGISGVFVHQKHHEQHRVGGPLPRLAGWWGYQESERFRMTPGFVPAAGADGWQISTPPIPALALHRAALTITAKAGLAAMRQKSEALTGFLAYLIAQYDAIQLLTPDDANQRGCQLSLLVRKRGKELFDHLTRDGIIGDWREPDCIRLAPTPLYNTFEEVWHVGQSLRRFFGRIG